MKISIIQSDIIWSNPEENRRRMEEKLNTLPAADLYVFPEMFSTGFCTEPHQIAEEADKPGTLEWMQTTAQKKQCALAGSVATHAEGKYYNRFYFVYPDGSYHAYDKKHLFTYGGEHLTFTPGQERVVVTYKGVRILLQVCYDLRFPVWARNRKDYDMILYVASWPETRIEAWNTLLHARAIENQCYVAGVNRVGTDPSCAYCGSSILIDPYGKTLAACKPNEEDAVSTLIDLEGLESFRKKFPVLNDADPFTLTP